MDKIVSHLCRSTWLTMFQFWKKGEPVRIDRVDPPGMSDIWVLFGYYGHKKSLHDTAQCKSKITILRILLHTTKPHKKSEPQFVISRLQVRFLLLAPRKRTLKRIVLAFFCFLPVLPYGIWVLFGYYGLKNEKKVISQQALCRPAGRFFYACFFGAGAEF